MWHSFKQNIKKASSFPLFSWVLSLISLPFLAYVAGQVYGGHATWIIPALGAVAVFVLVGLCHCFATRPKQHMFALLGAGALALCSVALLAGFNRGRSLALTATASGVVVPTPEQKGNRYVRIHRRVHGGEHRLTAEFGVYQKSLPAGVYVGFHVSRPYGEWDCSFTGPSAVDKWVGGDRVPCTLLEQDTGGRQNDRLYVLATDTPITPRRSLYLTLRSDSEVALSNCVYRSANENSNTRCDSPLVEFYETSN